MQDHQNLDVHALLAQVRGMGFDPASDVELDGEVNVPYRELSLAQLSSEQRDEQVVKALHTPQSASDPRWAARMPKPPCEQCHGDHKGNRSYNHQYVHPIEVQRALEHMARVEAEGGIPQPAYANQPTPIRQGVEREIVNRVAIYDSRTDYIVKVESPPEWDDVVKRKLTREQVMAVMPLLKALGVKIKNNSEDEFEEDSCANQSGADSQPANAGAHNGPRRSAEEAKREWAALLGDTVTSAPEPAPEHGDVGEDSNGQAARAPRRGRARKAS
jgi:hypothetical protein